MSKLELNLTILFLILNLGGFLLVGYDKRKAIKHAWRVPESRVFILACLGGAVGVYLGMQAFRHKTRHVLFVYGIPAAILWNIVLIGLVSRFFL